MCGVLGAWEACLSHCQCLLQSTKESRTIALLPVFLHVIVIVCSNYAAIASNVKKKWAAVPDVETSLERNRPAINVYNFRNVLCWLICDKHLHFLQCTKLFIQYIVLFIFQRYSSCWFWRKLSRFASGYYDERSLGNPKAVG